MLLCNKDLNLSWGKDFGESSTETHFHCRGWHKYHKSWLSTIFVKLGICSCASGSVKVPMEKMFSAYLTSSATENKAITSRLQQSGGQVVVKEIMKIKYLAVKRCGSSKESNTHLLFLKFLKLVFLKFLNFNLKQEFL